MPRKSAGPKATKETAPLRAGAAEADVKGSNLLRLRRIEGQIRGLQKMVEQDRRCPDILMQVASVQEALKGVSRELVRNHVEQCALQVVTGSGQHAKEAVDQLLAVWSKHAG
jgi:CsoR family transcriptional regulator, copper-sensing transcriptional repressor